MLKGYMHINITEMSQYAYVILFMQKQQQCMMSFILVVLLSLKIKSISLVYYNNYNVLGTLIPTPSISIWQRQWAEKKTTITTKTKTKYQRERGN